MLLGFLFPPKCILCHNLLKDNETDMCHSCRENAPEIFHAKRTVEFIAHWTAIWYYKDDVRQSIHRFKFNNRLGYAQPYGRLLAMKLMQTDYLKSIDVITWAPVSTLRRFKRGYDQAQLLAEALGNELGIPVVRLLKKRRHTRPQSLMKDISARKANIQGAYVAANAQLIKGKNILLIDDVLTTGATASECARILRTTGAESVCLATIAVTNNNTNKRR